MTAQVAEVPGHIASLVCCTRIKVLNYFVNNKNQLETQNGLVSQVKRDHSMACTARQEASSQQCDALPRGGEGRAYTSLQEQHWSTHQLLQLKSHSGCCLKVAVGRGKALELCFTFNSQHCVQEISPLLGGTSGLVPRQEGRRISPANSNPHVDVLLG